MTNDDIVFPHPTLTPITGDPTRTSLQLLKKQLFANARAVPTNLGGGRYGHLALLMTPAEYTALPNTAPFPAPPHPGPLPLHDQAQLTQFQLTQLNRVYDAQLATFRLYHNVSERLKKLILEAVDSKYLATLEDDTMGYATVTPQAMLAHLIATYGPIKPADLDANRERLVAAWTPEESVEDLWKRIRECQIFAAAGGEAITDATAMRLTLTVFAKTGVFHSAVDKWKDKPAVQHTMANFQAHFKEENDRRMETLTSAQAGFQRANAVTASEANDTFPGDDNTPHVAFAATTIADKPTPANGTTVYYCWTHGIGFNATHTSATCKAPKPGHSTTATLRNMQGGANTVMQRARRLPRTPATTTP